MSFNFFTSPGDRYMVGQRPTSITSSTWSWILWLKPDWQRLAESTNLWPMSISNAWNTSGDYTHQYAAQYEKFVGADSYGCLVYDTGQSGINASVRDQDGTCSGWVPLVCRVFSDSLQKAAAMTFNSQNQLSEANSVNNTMNYLALGTVKGHAGAWDGKLGEFGLWDVALSDAETTALLKGARPDSIRPRNMVAYHPMRRLDGIYSRDESPSNYRKWDVAVAFPSYSWPNLLSLNDNPPVFVPTNRDLRSWLQSKKYFIPTPVWEFAATVTRPYKDVSPEISEILVDDENNTSTPKSIGYPAHSTGDLLIQFIAMDAAASTTMTLPSTGPNSETVTTLYNGATGNQQELACYYWIAAADTAAGTLSVSSSIGEEMQARCVRIKAGTFNVASPIDSSATTGDQGTTATIAPTPSWACTTGGGLILTATAVDADWTVPPIPAGWEMLSGFARDTYASGQLNLTLARREALTTAGETISSVNIYIGNDGDSNFTLGLVVKPPDSTQAVVTTSAQVFGKKKIGGTV